MAIIIRRFPLYKGLRGPPEVLEKYPWSKDADHPFQFDVFEPSNWYEYLQRQGYKSKLPDEKYYVYSVVVFGNPPVKKPPQFPQRPGTFSLFPGPRSDGSGREVNKHGMLPE